MSADPIQRRLVRWMTGLVALVLALLIGMTIVALRYSGPAVEHVRGPVMLFAFGGTVLFALAVLAVWRALNRRMLAPLGSVARDVRTLLETKQMERGLRLPAKHGLGDLPEAVAELIDQLRSARRGTVRAMATATARVEREKGWLEVVLLELVREGVVVCSADHRILLYNRPAARLFRDSLGLGLGRAIFDVVAPEPVRHALERLEYRRQSGRRDLSLPFVCATRDAAMMLQASMALVIDQTGKSNGYVLTLEDISADLRERQRSDAVRRGVTQDLRGPVASLRAAAENLSSLSDIDAAQRSAFQNVMLEQSVVLSDRLEALASAYEEGVVGKWPMTEIHSPDLFQCLARHLRGDPGVDLDIRGQSQWLMGDSLSLMQVLAHLIERLSQRGETREFEIEAGRGPTHTFIELRWHGYAVSDSVLGEWLNETLPQIGITAAQVLEEHGSEPWSSVSADGRALIRIPLQLPVEAPVEAAEGRLPPRPEFYDFDLMYAHSLTGELANRRLKELTYVVFDTETTGLRPTAGDEIIEIAAVRVTGGRVMTGETFDTLINPARPIPKDSIRFHGITDDTVRDESPIADILPRFQEFAGDAVLVAHNAAFDMKFLKLKEAQTGVVLSNPVIDTLLLSLLIEGGEENHSLDAICERLHISVENRHRALGDAVATAHVLVALLDRLAAKGIETFAQLMSASDMEAALRFRTGHF